MSDPGESHIDPAHLVAFGRPTKFPRRAHAVMFVVVFFMFGGFRIFLEKTGVAVRVAAATLIVCAVAGLIIRARRRRQR